MNEYKYVAIDSDNYVVEGGDDLEHLKARMLEELDTEELHDFGEGIAIYQHVDTWKYVPSKLEPAVAKKKTKKKEAK